MEKTLRINPCDNVAVQLADGHKIALCDIKKGENVIKYGFPIGHASEDIKKGDKVHTHNLKTNLSGKINYSYEPEFTEIPRKTDIPEFSGYVRRNGDVGIRNDIWIINTVGCINKTAEAIAKATGAKFFPHPFGCSQLGGDMEITQKILKGMVNHPNAGGVLVLGLGCENNNIDVFRGILGGYDRERVKFLNCQECGDEIKSGIEAVAELKRYTSGLKRESIPVSKLKIGLKCGGSDAYSGITANPLVGRLSDLLISYGGSSILTEVPEMFGAEQLLMKRCRNKEIFNKTVSLINDFKEYFIRHNQVIYENPSPGNKAGGITTLEEKSLGCVQKGGSGVIADVLNYGDTLTAPGLNLLCGPGNDMVAVTNLAACGVHMILFTTGRGTPFGGPVPTVKISTNSALSERKRNWIDFNAGEILNGKELTNELFDFCIKVAGGKKTKNEINGFEEISIFKDGVTL
ncbi:MAG: altronate dehydratase [Clostridia bacterium]|nr:altronate dehydratase [Clostridia bacterium]